MGGEQSKDSKTKIDKVQLELKCQETFYKVQIERDRKINELQKKENVMHEHLTAPNMSS